MRSVGTYKLLHRCLLEICTFRAVVKGAVHDALEAVHDVVVRVVEVLVLPDELPKLVRALPAVCGRAWSRYVYGKCARKEAGGVQLRARRSALSFAPGCSGAGDSVGLLRTYAFANERSRISLGRAQKRRTLE